ncbi:MAG: hypothetical protein ACR2JQ_02355 [Mycobacteriales bacterium]
MIAPLARSFTTLIEVSEWPPAPSVMLPLKASEPICTEPSRRTATCALNFGGAVISAGDR